jgi:hypothetical protein
MGGSTARNVYQERKSLVGYEDFADEITDYTPTAAENALGTSTVTLDIADAANVIAGAYVVQAATGGVGWVTDIDYATGVLTIATNSSSVSAFNGSDDVSVYTAVPSTLTFVPHHAGVPNEQKHYRQITPHFHVGQFYRAKIRYQTDLNRTGSDDTLIQFPSFDFGDTESYRNRALPVTPAYQRCSFLYVTLTFPYALSKWKLSGLTYDFEVMSERNSR